MADPQRRHAPPPEVAAFYATFPQETRLGLEKDMLDIARALETQPSVQGVSAHLLGAGRKP